MQTHIDIKKQHEKRNKNLINKITKCKLNGNMSPHSKTVSDPEIETNTKTDAPNKNTTFANLSFNGALLQKRTAQPVLLYKMCF